MVGAGYVVANRKHFEDIWPEKRIECMREAAVEFGKLERLNSQLHESWSQDAEIDAESPCMEMLKSLEKDMDLVEEAVSKMDRCKVEMIRTYREHRIPVNWLQV